MYPYLNQIYLDKRKYEIFPSSEAPVFAIFDELLESKSFGSTARGSGTLLFQSGHWFIVAYHITFPIPNDLAKGITASIMRFEKNETAATADMNAADLIRELELEEQTTVGSAGGKKTGKAKGKKK